MRRSSLLAVLSLLLLSGCTVAKKTTALPVITSHPVQVRAVKVEGKMLPVQEAGIYARRSGIIQTLHVDIGSRVKQGQVVAVLQPDKTQSELGADLAFLQRQLQIAREREVAEVREVEQQASIILETAKKESETAKKGHEAELKRIETEISSTEAEAEQRLTLASQTVFNLLSAITDMLYRRSDVPRNYGSYASDDYYRRHELFYPHSTQALAFETKFMSLYRTLQGAGTDVTKEHIGSALELSKEARLLTGNIASSPDLPEERVEALRGSVASASDRLVTEWTSHQLAQAKLQSLRAQREQYAAWVKQPSLSPLLPSTVPSFSAASIEAEIQRVKGQIGAARTVVSPFAGVITKRTIAVGESVDLDRPLLRIMDDSRMFVRFSVDEAVFPLVREGQEISFSPLSAPSELRSAVIRRISREIDAETGKIRVEADIAGNGNADRMVSQMSLLVFLPLPEKTALFEIPESALQVANRSNIVWIEGKGSRAEPRPVTVRFAQDGYAYISEGLQKEDAVIVESLTELTAALPVRGRTGTGEYAGEL